MKKIGGIFLSIFLLCGALIAYPFQSATDATGVATSIYQLYLENGASGELTLASNVSGYERKEADKFIYDALVLSSRLLPWALDANVDYPHDVDPTHFKVEFKGRELQDQNQEVIAKIDDLANEASKLPTDVDRIKFINDYIVDNCEYSNAAVNKPSKYENAFTTYGCLIEGSAVCEGYANAVMLFCEALKIPCVKVLGTANGSNHVWNSVYLNNRWWMLDTTFNDPNNKKEDSDRYKYFLLDIDTFSEKKSHTYDTEQFELSKKIFTGRTKGQYEHGVFYDNCELSNAKKGDTLSISE